MLKPLDFNAAVPDLMSPLWTPSSAVRRGRDLLRKIGEDLQKGIQPDVYPGGVVLPGGTNASMYFSPGKEICDDASFAQAGSPGSATGSREGQRAPSTGRSAPWAPTGARPLEFSGVEPPGLSDDVQDDLRGVIAAYSQWQVRSTAEVSWLHGWVRPVLGLSDRVFVVTRYPHNVAEVVESWAWWGTGIWVGPAHTNYGNGSVCAYEPRHETWRRGHDRLWQLIDLTVVWSTRQMHLRYFGFWPGQQVLHTPEERVRDHSPGELCGCDRFGFKYEDCCHRMDIAYIAKQQSRNRPLRWFPNRTPGMRVRNFFFNGLIS